MPELDDATVAYILETRRAFEDLRQAAAQLAGLLVLEAAGAKNELPLHPMLAAAEELSLEAEEKIHQARATVRAERHQGHLADAAAHLLRAVRKARRNAEMGPILSPLRAAYAELEAATRELPGFDMVAFDRGCCGPIRRTE